MAEEAEDFIFSRKTALANRRFTVVAEAVDEILTAEKVTHPISPASRDALAYLALRAQIEAAGLTADLFRGKQDPFGPRDAIDDVLRQPTLTSTKTPASDSAAAGMNLGELAVRFMREQTGGLKPRTCVKYQWQLDVACQYFGSATKANLIDRRKVTQYRDLLQNLPAHFSKRFEGKTLIEIAALPATERTPLLKPTAINPYLTSLAQLFDYAESIGEGSQNPASRMHLKDPVKAKDKRLPFNIDHLQTLFSQPLYVGHDGSHWAKAGSKIDRDLRYWVPLIGLFTGMRLGEICDLTPECVIVEDGIVAFDVRDAKTSNGIRKVPVHPNLILLGVREFIKTAKPGNDRPPQSGPGGMLIQHRHFD